MERELALVLLVLLVCGSTLCLSGALPGWTRPEGSGRQLERRRWLAIWLRLLPTGAALGMLVGWAFQEPEPTDEALLPTTLLILVPVAIVWTRAALRAAAALTPSEATPSVATIGLFRPRFVIGAEVVRFLDANALRALRYHEEAHVRHRDPLRIWLAQLATDLQWPWPSARARFCDWLRALELARDEEARFRGADGPDLAAAVLGVARISGSHRGGLLHAGLIGDGEALADRVRQLLSPLLPAPLLSRTERWLLPLTTTSLLLAAFLVGLHYGEAVICAVPGVVRDVHTGEPLVRAFIG